MKIVAKYKGGPGSGNFSHVGRPGFVGGSASAGGVKPAGYDLSKSGNTKICQNILNDNLTVLGNGLYTYWRSADGNVRSKVKQQIISDLSKRSGVPERVVSEIIGQWATSSNNNTLSLATQEAAAKEFDIPLSNWQQQLIESAKAYQRGFMPVGEQDKDISLDDVMEMGQQFPWRESTPETRQQVLRAMYNATQEAFAEQGLGPDDTVRLVRGVKLPGTMADNWMPGDMIDYQGSAIESWSISPYIATRFGHDTTAETWDKSGNIGIVVMADIPVRNIIGSARTGFGCLTEGEFVVMGNSIPGATAIVAGRDASMTETKDRIVAAVTEGVDIDEYMYAWSKTVPHGELHNP